MNQVCLIFSFTSLIAFYSSTVLFILFQSARLRSVRTHQRSAMALACFVCLICFCGMIPMVVIQQIPIAVMWAGVLLTVIVVALKWAPVMLQRTTYPNGRLFPLATLKTLNLATSRLFYSSMSFSLSTFVFGISCFAGISLHSIALVSDMLALANVWQFTALASIVYFLGKSIIEMLERKTRIPRLPCARAIFGQDNRSATSSIPENHSRRRESDDTHSHNDTTTDHHISGDEDELRQHVPPRHDDNSSPNDDEIREHRNNFAMMTCDNAFLTGTSAFATAVSPTTSPAWRHSSKMETFSRMVVPRRLSCSDVQPNNHKGGHAEGQI